MTDDDDDDSEPGTQRFPEWKAAAAKFEADPVPYGTTLEHDWFFQAFDIPPPLEAATVAEFQKRQLRYLSCFKQFERWLLEDQQMMLRSIHGVGYEIVKPEKQARVAMGEFDDQLKKNFAKSGARLLNTRLDDLNSEQRREHADAMARWAHMRGMAKPRPKLELPPFTGDPEQFSGRKKPTDE